MHLIVLTREQVEIAWTRFLDYGNSTDRIARHHRRLDDEPTARLCLAIEKLEHEFGINLGTVCSKFMEKETRPTPHVQQQVMDYVAGWREFDGGEPDLVVSVDRIRQIDRLAEGDVAWLSSPDS